MTDPMTLFVGIGTQLRTAAEIAIGLSKLQTMTEVNAKAIELQGAILSLQNDSFSAQSQQSSMIQRVRDLEEEITRVKAWEETKQRYALYPLGDGGVFVYALKKEGAGAEPPHWICAHCYEDGRKSILQMFGRRDLEFGCHHCKSIVHPRFESGDTWLPAYV